MSLVEALEHDVNTTLNCVNKYNLFDRMASELSFEEHLEYQRCLFGVQASPLLQQGLYADILEWWLRFFDKQQFLVFLFEDYKESPRWVEEKIIHRLELSGKSFPHFARHQKR